MKRGKARSGSDGKEPAGAPSPAQAPPAAAVTADELEQLFAFECWTLHLDLPSFDALLESAGLEDRQELAEAREKAFDAYRANNYELFEARVQVMFFMGHLFAQVPLARRAWVQQRALRVGAAEANRKRAKLPEPESLRDELQEKRANGSEDSAAKNALCQKYGCTRQALNRKLAKASQAPAKSAKKK